MQHSCAFGTIPTCKLTLCAGAKTFKTIRMNKKAFAHIEAVIVQMCALLDHADSEGKKVGREYRKLAMSI